MSNGEIPAGSEIQHPSKLIADDSTILPEMEVVDHESWNVLSDAQCHKNAIASLHKSELDKIYLDTRSIALRRRYLGITALKDNIRSAELQNLRAELVADRREKRGLFLDELNEHAQRVIAKITNPENSFHPIYRTVLETPHLTGGSLASGNTFEVVESMANSLMEVNRQLEEADEAQPAIVVTDTYPEPVIDYRRLQIDYGLTMPGEGLVSKVEERLLQVHPSGKKEYGLQSMFHIPTLGEPAPAAVMSPSYNSHYLTSSGKEVKLEADGTRVRTVISNGESAPTVDGLRIVLPRGNLFLPSLRDNPFADNSRRIAQEPLVRYGIPSGKEVIPMPISYEVKLKTAHVAIGEKAVKKALERMHSAEVTFGQDPNVVRKMVEEVSRGLGYVVLKDGQFAKTRLTNYVSPNHGFMVAVD